MAKALLCSEKRYRIVSQEETPPCPMTPLPSCSLPALDPICHGCNARLSASCRLGKAVIPLHCFLPYTCLWVQRLTVTHLAEVCSSAICHKYLSYCSYGYGNQPSSRPVLAWGSFTCFVSMKIQRNNLYLCRGKPSQLFNKLLSPHPYVYSLLDLKKKEKKTPTLSIPILQCHSSICL